MGIDNNAVKLLFAAQAADVSFRQTLTLGRQNFFPNANTLQDLFGLFRIERDGGAFLAESKGYAEEFFKLLGADEVVAIDRSGYEGAAIVADLNTPIDASLKNRFTAIFDGGCLEHVFNFPQAIRNCMEMLTVGGHFIAVTPANNFCGHGFYQFSPELFFRIFSADNGFAIRAILTKEKENWYRVVDPAEAGRRVELQNTRPTYLFILAQKTTAKDPFTHAPQQSDYRKRWEEDASGSDLSRASRTGRRLRDFVPLQLKERLRPLYVNLPIRFRSKYYVKIKEARLLSGDFS